MTGILDRELQTFNAQKSRLIGKAKGKFALVKEDKVIDFFDTKPDAIRRGYEQFGNVPFLVKQIIEVDIPQNFTSNLIKK